MHASVGALDLSPSLFWRSKLRRQRRFCMTFAIVWRRRDYVWVDHAFGRVRVNEWRDDLIVRGINHGFHIESFAPRVKQADRRCADGSDVHQFGLRSTLYRSLAHWFDRYFLFFQWQQKKRRVHSYQYSHQTKQRESNCTRPLSLKSRGWYTRQCVTSYTHRLSGCIVWNCMLRIQIESFAHSHSRLACDGRHCLSSPWPLSVAHIAPARSIRRRVISS